MTSIRYIADRLVRSPEQYPTRDVSGLRGIALHHTKGHRGPEDIARGHVLERGWPGIGYSFVIDDNAGPSVIYQTADLERATYHAGVHNRARVGVALVGDFDRAEPHPNQIHAAAWLCGVLCEALELGDPSDHTGPLRLFGRVVAGHCELWGASSKTGKTCPGDRFDLTGFRTLASLHYRDRLAAGQGWDAIKRAGLVCPEIGA